MPNTELLKQYMDEVPAALLAFQYLEEALRQYMLRCHVMIATVVKPILAYRIQQYDRVEKMTLGQLVSSFQDFNVNQELIARLAPLPQRRNQIAHRAYLTAWQAHSSDSLDESDLHALRSLIVEARETMLQVFREVEAIEERFVAFRSKGSANS
ncbi:MAG: hypothetical protein NUV63_02490 [Gallionella sp.]|nr:hypothetical protein [Gallionella sp.]